jgi:hypothetical protein
LKFVKSFKEDGTFTFGKFDEKQSEFKMAEELEKSRANKKRNKIYEYDMKTDTNKKVPGMKILMNKPMN